MSRFRAKSNRLTTQSFFFASGKVSMLRVNLSVRNNGQTSVMSWDDPAFVGTVNGVRVHTAPGQPFSLYLKGSKIPFQMIARPHSLPDEFNIHVDLQVLLEHLARAAAGTSEHLESESTAGKKRARDENEQAEDAALPKKKRVRKPLTEEQKAARKAAADARRAAASDNNNNKDEAAPSGSDAASGAAAHDE